MGGNRVCGDKGEHSAWDVCAIACEAGVVSRVQLLYGWPKNSAKSAKGLAFRLNLT